MENNDKADKQARKNAGEQNAFRKTHTKDRQNKRKNKPTIGKFQTKNASKSISNNSFVTFNSYDEEEEDQNVPAMKKEEDPFLNW